MIFELELEYADLKLNSSKPLELLGATVGASIGAFISLKYKLVFAAPAAIAVVYSGLMYYKPGNAITEEVMQIIGVNALKGATGPIVLGAKAGSYLDDICAETYSFAVQNNLALKSGLWYEHISQLSYQAKDAVGGFAYDQMIKILRAYYSKNEEPTPEPKAEKAPPPEPEAEKAPTPEPAPEPKAATEPTPVKESTIFERIYVMQEEVKESFSQYHELYQDAWNWMFGTNSSDAH